MPKAILTGLVILAAAALAPKGAVAAETDSDVASVYRLNLERPAAFRLEARPPDGPVSKARTEPAISSLLANRPYAVLIHRAARHAALDPALVHAVISVESGYNPKARSPKGAIGLMQVMPETALRYGVRDPAHSLEANLRAGTQYLSDLMQQFDGRLDLVLAAYNAGEKAVLRHGVRIPPYRETRFYVPAVLAKYYNWREALGATPAPIVSSIEYLPGTRLELIPRRPSENR